MGQKIRKRVQRRGQTFFPDQSAGLNKTPLAVSRELALAKWKLFERNARSYNVDLVFGAAELADSGAQRIGADKYPRDRSQHLAGGGAVSRLFHIDQNVGAVK